MIEFYIRGLGSENAMKTNTEVGLRMGKTFISSLDGFIGLKEKPESNSRVNHGVVHSMRILRYAQRKLTLPFVVFGTSKEDFRAKKNAFEQVLLTYGGIEIVVPKIENVCYRLTYAGDAQSYNLSFDGRICSVSISMTEDNPADRALPTGFTL